MDTRQKFKKRKRLIQAVIRAAFERIHPVFDPAAGSQHQDRQPGLFGPDPANDADAVESGQVQVDNQKVETALRLKRTQRSFTVRSLVDNEALAAELFRQET
jgi:hypothetical protein